VAEFRLAYYLRIGYLGRLLVIGLFYQDFWEDRSFFSPWSFQVYVVGFQVATVLVVCLVVMRNLNRWLT